MRVTLLVEMDIQPVQGAAPTTEQQRKACQEAVINAIKYAEGEGHEHPLASTASILLVSVGLTK